MSNRLIVLMSGGIDSAACASLMLRGGRSVTGLFVDYGQKARSPERESASQLSKFLNIPLKIVSAALDGPLATGELVGRNAFLIFVAIMSCQLREGSVALGINSGTTYYDCTPAFLDSVNRLVAEYTNGCAQVVTPFMGWSKRDVFECFLSAALPLDLTYSCEAGEVPPCGKCLLRCRVGGPSGC